MIHFFSQCVFIVFLLQLVKHVIIKEAESLILNCHSFKLKVQDLNFRLYLF